MKHSVVPSIVSTGIVMIFLTDTDTILDRLTVENITHRCQKTLEIQLQKSIHTHS